MTEQLATLPTPAELIERHTLEPGAADIIEGHRREVVDIMEGRDSRLLVVVGPCSLDDTRQPGGEYSAVSFARQLQELSEDPLISQHLKIVMRCPPAKPRTDLGQRGLEQTNLDGSREILTRIANMGVPLATEVMHARHLANYGDLMSLVWTGARNGDDVHLRHALSAYPAIPVWCKNGSDGTPSMATNALKTIRAPHENVELIRPDGHTGVLPKSPGNPRAAGMIYRGGANARTPQEYERHLLAASAVAQKLGIALGADTAHGGSVAHSGDKSAEGQRQAHKHVLAMMAGKLATVRALWIEAYMLEGADTSGNTPGKSLTDACVCVNGLRDMLFETAQVQKKLQDEK